MDEDKEKIKLHCNMCMGKRWHTTLYNTQKEHFEELDDFGNEYHEFCNYRLAECDGCESISLHTEWWCSGQSEKVVEQWPPKTSRRQPKWLFDLIFMESISNPYKREFLSEIYIALKNENLRLAVLGMRGLLEQVMIESVGDQGNFVKNLARFEADGYISGVQKDAIGPVIEAGHASMHRGFKPSKQEVEAIMDVVENVIESIYISKQKAAGLKIPERPKKHNTQK
ncbi:DUF4145 domain-containing protein [Herbaspirillum sp. ST 5-3]|uniref:DUF4145 domain-containing protein n=1 Tax=Oxalobacteraceae TaxID=75682 RepID=UPI0010A5331D|nr:DUF4145 domain-containing protein [Herbaspirillum sp. ST 5-3]